MKTEEARGWGIRVNDLPPRLATVFFWSKARTKDECIDHGERPVRVVLLPLAEFRRLKRLEQPASLAREGR